MIRSVLLVANPAARRGRLAEALAVDALRAAGVGVDVVRTTQSGDASRFARELAAGHDAVFTLGGDGTAMEVIGALAGQGPPVGVLPGGTGNQLARHLGTPLDVRRAVGVLLRGEEFRMDLGRLSDGRYFSLTAGFGMDVEMMLGASTAWKRRVGVGAYIWSGLGALMRNARVPVRATVDGVRYEALCGMAMIANVGSLLDGFIATGPDVRTDDGLLDLCLYHPVTVPQAMDVTLRCIRKDFRAHPAMTFARGRHITLEADSSFSAQADGEILGPVRLDATAAPSAAVLIRGV